MEGLFNNLLVNDGGRDATGKHVMDMANDDWDMMIRTNLHGAFWCCRSFGGLSMNLGQGRVSN